MKLEEAITYAIMSDGHEGRSAAQVYAVICRYPSNVLATRARSEEPCTKEEGRIRVML